MLVYDKYRRVRSHHRRQYRHEKNR